MKKDREQGSKKEQVHDSPLFEQFEAKLLLVDQVLEDQDTKRLKIELEQLNLQYKEMDDLFLISLPKEMAIFRDQIKNEYQMVKKSAQQAIDLHLLKN